MTVTVFGLTMASNAQFHENAFQAAESGIDVMIERRNFSTAGPTVLPSTSIGDGTYEMAGTMNFAETTPVPDRAFSIGVTNGGVQAYHFDIVATGTGPDSASSTQNQSFYVVGPGN